MDAAARCGQAAGPRCAPAAPAWRQRAARGQQPPRAARRGVHSLGFAGSAVAGAALHAAPPARGRRGAAPAPAAVAVPGTSDVPASNPKDADEVRDPGSCCCHAAAARAARAAPR